MRPLLNVSHFPDSFASFQIVSQFPDYFAFLKKIHQFRKDFANSSLPQMNSSNQSDRGLKTEIFILSRSPIELLPRVDRAFLISLKNLKDEN